MVAIEPHPVSCELLEAFGRLNRLANVTPLNLAVTDEPGPVRLVESADWRAHALGPAGSSTGIAVRAETLDRLCETYGVDHVDFAKMNSEGAELQALEGAQEMLVRTGSRCVACHDFLADHGHGDRYRTLESVERFLIDRGFQTLTHPEDPREYARFHVFASRETR